LINNLAITSRRRLFHLRVVDSD